MSNARFTRILGVATVVAAFALSALPQAVHARDGGGSKRNARAAHHSGGNWTRTSQVQRTENGHTRSDHWQGQDGRTASRDVVVTNDRDAGTRTRNAVWTGPKGEQTRVDTVTQRTDSGFTRDTIVTRPDGATATRDMTVARDAEAGTRSVDVTRTGFDGRTSSYSSTTQRTDDGYERDVTQTLPSGQVRTRSIDVSCDPAAKSCTKTVEHDGGD